MQSSLRGLERKVAHPELHGPFNEAMVLLIEIIEILPLAEFTRAWRYL